MCRKILKLAVFEDCVREILDADLPLEQEVQVRTVLIALSRRQIFFEDFFAIC